MATNSLYRKTSLILTSCNSAISKLNKITVYEHMQEIMLFNFSENSQKNPKV